MSRSPVINVTITGDSKDAQRAARDAAGEFEGFGKKVSGFAVGAGAAVTTFAINAIPKLVNFGSELVELGRTSQINLAKADTVFGESAAGIKEWADDINGSMGLSDEAVVGLAAGMGDLLVPLGFSRDAAAEMSKETIGLSGALSAWSGGQYDAAAVSDILTKAMLGERDSLKALGISLNQAEVDERAMAVARAEGREEITAQDKAIATQQLILEKSTDAQEAWADGTMDAVKSQNELSAKVADAKESLAKGLLPIVEKVTKWIVDSFIPAVERTVEAFRQKWPQIRAAVEPVLQWLQGTIGSFVETALAFWDRFGDRITTYTGIVFDYVRSTIANAMQVIQGVIDVVLGVLTGDWSKAWDGMKKILGGVWDQITNLVRAALRVVGLVLDMAWENMKSVTRNAWSGIVDAVSSAITGVVQFHRELPGRILRAIGGIGTLLLVKGRELIDGLKLGASIGWDIASGWVAGIPGRILGALSGLGSLLYDIGSSIIGGLARGMYDAWTAPARWLGGLASSIVNLKGPPAYDATVLKGNGRLIMSGLLDGMRDGWGNVESFLGGLAPTVSVLAGADVTAPTPARAPSTSGNVINNWPVGIRPADAVDAGRTYDRIQGTRI